MLEAAFVVVCALESSQEHVWLFHSALSAWKQPSGPPHGIPPEL